MDYNKEEYQQAMEDLENRIPKFDINEEYPSAYMEKPNKRKLHKSGFEENYIYE